MNIASRLSATLRQQIQVMALVVMVLVLNLLDATHVITFSSELLPLFLLCASGCGCGNDSDSGGEDWGGPSTPFLATWNGERFELENDFLFGKPSSHFRTPEEGRSAYEAGLFAGDLYRIQNTFTRKEGQLSFQIREIEPEESFIDHLRLLRVVYPQKSELFVDSRFQKVFALEVDAIENHEGVVSQKITTGSGIELPAYLSSLTNNPNDGHVMDTGDVLNIDAEVESSGEGIILLLDSHYRDWSLGEIFMGDSAAKSKKVMEAIRSTYVSTWSTEGSYMQGGLRIVGLALVLALLWTSSLATSAVRHLRSPGADRAAVSDTLITAFGTPNAYADDSPDDSRSLVVEYRTAHGGYEMVDVIEPRYYQPSTAAVLVPQEALGVGNRVSLRIRATKRHKVRGVVLVAPRALLPVKKEALKVTRAWHQRHAKDYTEILNENQSGEYLHTVPADVVDISFTPPKNSTDGSMQEAYLIESSGFYSDLSEAGEMEAGDWLKRLEPSDYAWLQDMHALRMRYAHQDP